jgi:hypothetical protein
MSDQAFIRDRLTNDLTESQRYALVKLAEEAAELAQIAMKTLLWGFDSYNPKQPEKGSNLDQISAEFNDVIEAFSRLNKSRQ